MKTKLRVLNIVLILLIVVSVLLPIYRVSDAVYIFDDVNGLYDLSDILEVSKVRLFSILLVVGVLILLIDHKRPNLGKILFIAYAILIFLAPRTALYLFKEELFEEYYANINRRIGFYLLKGSPILLIINSLLFFFMKNKPGVSIV